jgi:hypothetical protein
MCGPLVYCCSSWFLFLFHFAIDFFFFAFCLHPIKWNVSFRWGCEFVYIYIISRYYYCLSTTKSDPVLWKFDRFDRALNIIIIEWVMGWWSFILEFAVWHFCNSKYVSNLWGKRMGCNFFNSFLPFIRNWILLQSWLETFCC